MTSSRQLTDLDRYLARHGFRPHASHSTWLDRDTGQHIIRIVRESGEQTELICLTLRGVCLYKAAFCPGTPDAVIIAAIKATAPRPARPGPDQAGHRPAARARTKR